MEKAYDIVLVERSIPELTAKTTGERHGDAHSALRRGRLAGAAGGAAFAAVAWLGVAPFAGGAAGVLAVAAGGRDTAGLSGRLAAARAGLSGDQPGAGGAHRGGLSRCLCAGLRPCAGLAAGAWPAATPDCVCLQCWRVWPVG